MFLYGASGHAKVIIEILEKAKIRINGLFDDNTAIVDLLKYPCYGSFKKEIIKNDTLIVSIGDNKIRGKIVNRLNYNHFGKAVDIDSVVSKYAVIYEGTVIMPGAIVNSGVEIGKHVIINTSASVDHDCVVGDFVHVSPNSTLCGNISVGTGTLIGAGSVLKPGINIGKWCIIGVGSVIVKDVPDFAVMFGNPGRIIKYDNFDL